MTVPPGWAPKPSSRGRLRGHGKALRRLRGVRVRLTATYVLAAVVLAVVGYQLFVTQLARSVRHSVDSSLSAESEQIRDSLGSSATLGPRENDPSLVGLYRPDGTLASGVAIGGRPQTGTRSLRAGDRTLRIHTDPLPRTDGVWSLVVAADLSRAQDSAKDAARDLKIAAPVLLIGVGVLTWLLSGAALRPVERMRSDAARVDATRVSVPDTEDEIARLAVTFNDLLDRLHGSLRQQRALVADAGHELRTPLAVLRMELELADRPSRTREDLLDSVRHAAGEVDRLAALSDNLLWLARLDDGELAASRSEVDGADLAEEVARAYRAAAQAAGVNLIVDAEPGLVLAADRDALRRAVDNLVSNAIGLAASTVTIRTARRANVVVIGVDDDGPGFDPEFLPHAFARFRRAEMSRTRHGPGGAGLGLAIVAGIASLHEGRAVAANRPEGGATVELLIPG